MQKCKQNRTLNTTYYGGKIETKIDFMNIEVIEGMIQSLDKEGIEGASCI